MSALKDIFISYRRDTGAELAELVKKDLVSRGYSVFKDTHDLKAGHWQEDLRRQITACMDFILIVTPGTLERCKTDPDDVVLFEIQLALTLQKNFILVVKRGKNDSPEKLFDGLPPTLSTLPKHNWIEYTNEDADAKLSKIRNFLESSPSVFELVVNRYGRQLLAGITCGGMILCGLASWALFGSAERLENQVASVAGDTKVTLETTGTIAEQNRKIANTTEAIRKDNVELLDKTREAARSSGESREVSAQTLSAVQGLETQFNEVRKSIRQAIGTKNLGEEYDCTQFHRQYQDEMLETKTGNEQKLHSLVLEYQQLAASRPRNAMYRYLLARLYDMSGKPDLAVAEANAGLSADPSYMWNRRLLLYVNTTQPLDIDSRLAMERVHYALTPREIEMFSSRDPADFVGAFEGLKRRFQADPTISADLERLMCWHFFRQLCAVAYDDGKAFQNLVGQEAVSGRNLVSIKISEVKVGMDALSLIGKAPVSIVTDEEGRERIGQSTLFRAVRSRKAEVLSPQRQLLQSFESPPVALRVSIASRHAVVNLDSIGSRRFGLGGHLRRTPTEELKRFFGAPSQFDESEMLGVPTTEIDVPEPMRPADFWIYFFGAPLPWKAGADAVFTFEFSVDVGKDKTRIVDSIDLTADAAKNAEKPRVDGVKALTLYQTLRQMKSSEVAGQQIRVPMEVRVQINYSGDHIKAHLFGSDDWEIDLRFGPKMASRELAETMVRLGLQWPASDVREELERLAKGDWLRFTGTVITNKAGVITVVPDAIEVGH
jgi:hypothetical protein